jgi:hypothetical protein
VTSSGASQGSASASNTVPSDHPNSQAALLTKHRKHPAIAPALREAGFQLLTIDSFDTDTLGTFTGEIKRLGTMLDTAGQKAQRAAEMAGVRFGVGSEGSFGPDPFLGATSWGIEVIAWWDSLHKYFVHEMIQGPETNYASVEAQTKDEAFAFVQRAGFPSHGVIVGHPGDPYFDKSINELSALRRAIGAALANGHVWLETDMRAHRNPTRLAMIERCAQALKTRLLTPCPGCELPGYGIHGVIAGARCEHCGEATRAARAHQLRCSACGYEAERVISETVSAERCDYCNP